MRCVRRSLVVRRTGSGGEQVWRSVQLLSVRVREHAQILGTFTQFHILLGDHRVRAPGRGGHSHADVRRVPRPADRPVGDHGTRNRDRSHQSRQHSSTL